MRLFSDDDGNINPYATFNELKLVLEDCEKHKRNKTLPDMSDDDGLFQEKLAAQQAVNWRVGTLWNFFFITIKQ